MPGHDLAGKVAVVTGSARGIGFAVAQRLAADGCRVVVNDIDGEALAGAAARLGAGEALSVTADVSNRADVRRLFEQATERFGGVDILVNEVPHLIGPPPDRFEVHDL